MSLWRDTVLGVTTQPAVEQFVVGHALARPLRDRFVAGETIDAGLAVTRGLNAAGLRVSLDHLGEDVRDGAAADAAGGAYAPLGGAGSRGGGESGLSLKPRQPGGRPAPPRGSGG